MRNEMKAQGGSGNHRKARRAMARTVVASACLAAWGYASAVQFETDTPDLKLRWDNTFKYSNAFRTKDRSSRIMSDFRTDDGDQNFDKGLISNRIDLLSEFDVTYRNFGGRISGAAWYDTVYNKRNDNGSPATSNNVSAAYNEFTEGTRDRMGRQCASTRRWTNPPWPPARWEEPPTSAFRRPVRGWSASESAASSSFLMMRARLGSKPSPFPGTFFGVAVSRQGALLAFGLRGKAFVSDDQAASWHESTTGVSSSIASGLGLTDGRFLLVTQAGDILVSDDGGRAFKRVAVKEPLPLTSLLETGKGQVLATSLRGVRRFGPL